MTILIGIILVIGGLYILSQLQKGGSIDKAIDSFCGVPAKKRQNINKPKTVVKQKVPIIRASNPKGETYWCVIMSERDSNDNWIEKEDYCVDLDSAKHSALIYQKSMNDCYRNIRVVEKEVDDQFDD